ncbi:glycosyltransferase family 1 protein [Ectothiorhodospiraceae bacterium BW-2]|nr:glycosyltransferase family 1 protein [Ectothiorhodospiraceae bacterium BW-2]
MKILQLCLSPGVGGLELYVLRSAIALQQRQIETLLVVRPDSLLQQRAEAAQLRVVTLACRSYRLPLITARRLAQIIDREAIDILHLHWGKDLLLAVLAKRLALRPLKLIYTRQMMLTRPKKDIYHQFIYRHVDRFLTITRQLQQLAQAYLPLPPQAVQQLYYGVSQPTKLSEAQRQQLRQQLGARHRTTLLIGLVGRMERNKGQHLFIEAIEQLVQEGQPVHATLIGPAMNLAYQQQLQQQSQRGQLSSCITLFGSHPNPIELMAAFDVVVLTSEMETFGLVLIEAMRAGVAVIGTHAGGVPEIIDDGVTGLLFTPNDVGQLTAQLRRLLDDPPLRQQIAAAGQAKADAEFAEPLHYERLLNHYRQLLADG